MTETETDKLAITKGEGLKNTKGSYITIPEHPVKNLATALSSVSLANETWWSPYIWINNQRSAEQWISAIGVTLDLDYDTPKIIPPPEDSALLNSIASNSMAMPGSLWHATPRGGRIIAVFKKQCFDKDLFRQAASGFAYLVAHAILNTPFSVDRQAVDLARLFYVPNTFAKNVQRSAKVITLRENPYTPEELASFAPKENPIIVVPNPDRSSYNPAKEKTDWDYAVTAWNKDHPEKYPDRNRRDTCPVCKDGASFSEFKYDSTKWSCFSTYHLESKVGRRGPSDISFFGDPLDLEAFRRGCQRSQVLRKDGYWPAPNEHVEKEKVLATRSSDPKEEALDLENTEDHVTSSHLKLVSGSSSSNPPPNNVPVDRPKIFLSPEAHEVISKTVQAITPCQEIFQRGSQLVKVNVPLRSPLHENLFGKTPTIAQLAGINLLEIITQYSVVVQTKTKKKKGSDEEEKVYIPVIPPGWLVEGVLARGVWPDIRPLEGIVEVPILRTNGTVLDKPGYDKQTGLIYRPTIPFHTVKPNPSKEEAKKAAEDLLDLVCDFPFSDSQTKDLYKTAWLSGVLTPFVRHSIPTAPLFLIDSNVRGSGKSMLCDIVSTIATGRPMPRNVNPCQEDEFKKLVTSLAIAGASFVLIDNVTGSMGSQALDAALTAPTWKDRILGKSEVTAEIPLSTIWFVTGNNVELKGDLCRRTIHIRLKSDEENPETRSDFKNKRLIETIKEKRAHYVNCALTILRAYTNEGMPKQEMRSIDFKDWSTIVRGSLIWLGYADPGITQIDLTERDSDHVGLAMFIEAYSFFPESSYGLSAAALINLAMSTRNGASLLQEALAELCPNRGKPPDSVMLGRRLASFRSRVVGKRYIDYADNYKKNKKDWVIKTKKE